MFFAYTKCTYIISHIAAKRIYAFSKLIWGNCGVKVSFLRVYLGALRSESGFSPSLLSWREWSAAPSARRVLSCLVAAVPRLSRRGALTRCGLAALAMLLGRRVSAALAARARAERGPQRGGSDAWPAAERWSSGASELPRLRESEGCAACDDNKGCVCLLQHLNNKQTATQRLQFVIVHFVSPKK